MKAFITGVGSGIGRATCLTFLENNWDVIGVIRNRDHGDSLIIEAENCSGSLNLIYCDLSTINFINEINSRLNILGVKRINVLINIAGTLSPMPFLDYTRSKILEVLNVNLVAPSLLISYLTPFLSGSPQSNIINISSMSGFQGSSRFSGLSIYGASKSALCSISESLALELESYNIIINALAIGSVNTQMLKDAFPGFQAKVSPNEMGDYIYSFGTHGFKFYNGKTIPVAMLDM